MRIIERTGRILSRPYWHRNLTIGKLIAFAVMNGTGTLVLLAIQIPLIEVVKLHYLAATLIGGCVGLLVKFVVAGTTIYRSQK